MEEEKKVERAIDREREREKERTIRKRERVRERGRGREREGCFCKRISSALEKFATIVNPGNKPTKVNWTL